MMEMRKSSLGKVSVRWGVVAPMFHTIMPGLGIAKVLSSEASSWQVVVCFALAMMLQAFVVVTVLLANRGYRFFVHLLDVGKGIHNFPLLPIAFMAQLWFLPECLDWWVGAFTSVKGKEAFFVFSGINSGVCLAVGAGFVPFALAKKVHPVLAGLQMMGYSRIFWSMEVLPLPFWQLEACQLLTIFVFPFLVSRCFKKIIAKEQDPTNAPPRSAVDGMPVMVEESIKLVASLQKQIAVQIQSTLQVPYKSSIPAQARSVSIKFHECHLSAFSDANVESFSKAMLANAPTGSNVFVGEGCVQVVLDRPVRASDADSLGAWDDSDGDIDGPLPMEDIVNDIIQRFPVSHGREGRITGVADDVFFAREAGDSLPPRPSSPDHIARNPPPAIISYPHVLSAAEDDEGVTFAVHVSGCIDGDVVKALLPGKDDNSPLRLIAESPAIPIPGQTIDAGCANVTIPSSHLAGGVVWLRVFRDGPAAAVSPVVPIVVAPSLEVAAEVDDVFWKHTSSHGPGSAASFLSDLATVLGGLDVARARAVIPTLLFFLAKHGKKSSVATVLRWGKKLSVPAPEGILVSALVQGDVEMVKVLAATGSGVDLASAQEGGLTALHFAAADPSGVMLRAILEARPLEARHCAQNCTDDGGVTPMCVARANCLHKNVDLIESEAADDTASASGSSSAGGRWPVLGGWRKALADMQDPHMEAAYRQCATAHFVAMDGIACACHLLAMVLALAWAASEGLDMNQWEPAVAILGDVGTLVAAISAESPLGVAYRRHRTAIVMGWHTMRSLLVAWIWFHKDVGCAAFQFCIEARALQVLTDACLVVIMRIPFYSSAIFFPLRSALVAGSCACMSHIYKEGQDPLATWSFAAILGLASVVPPGIVYVLESKERQAFLKTSVAKAKKA